MVFWIINFIEAPKSTHIAIDGIQTNGAVPATNIVATVFVAGTAPFVCVPAICIWAIFGSSIKLIIKNAKIKKIIEYLLALLLVVTAVIVVID